MIRLRSAALLCLLLLSFAAVARAQGADGEMQALEYLGGEEEQFVSSARSPRPISRIAENVSVISAEQISLLNAHTLAEVLNTVPGIQLSVLRTPGSFTFFSIQGASSSHVLVLVDGVPQNELSSNFPDIGTIPVQQIERIEIIKGAASAAWGSALGGVVNVITKSPDSERKASGSISASLGERLTADFQGEVSGTVNRFGYYLSGGNLRSNGLLPFNRVDINNVFGKVVYDLPQKGTITLGLNYREANRNVFESPPAIVDMRDTNKISYFSGFLSFAYPVSDRLSFDLLWREWHERYEDSSRDFSSKLLQSLTGNRQTIRGGSAKLTWGDSLDNVVAGLEYEHAADRQSDQFLPDLNTSVIHERTMDRLGIFANGALTFGRLTVLPGARLDHTGIASDNVSATLGATYRLTEKTVLRGYGARGYSLPYALLQQGLQKVWTIQTGAETSEIPYLWLKGTLFYNNILDSTTDFSTAPAAVSYTKQTKQGFEIEARTVPLYGVSLAVGYTLTDARDRETRTRLTAVPFHLGKLAVQYDDSRLGLRGILTGSYVWWNGEPAFNGRYKAIIWDLSLTQKLLPSRELSPELFFSAHNLFNGAQYSDEVLKNPHRWLESGVRFRF